MVSVFLHSCWINSNVSPGSVQTLDEVEEVGVTALLVVAAGASTVVVPAIW